MSITKFLKLPTENIISTSGDATAVIVMMSAVLRTKMCTVGCSVTKWPAER